MLACFAPITTNGWSGKKLYQPIKYKVLYPDKLWKASLRKVYHSYSVFNKYVTGLKYAGSDCLMQFVSGSDSYVVLSILLIMLVYFSVFMGK